MIRVGLVGFGMGGRVFHAPLISSVQGLELAAVVERTSGRAAELYPGITTHHAVDEMLADESIGLFVVSTPNGTHFEIARQILEAGRHVIVDKPVCTNSVEVAQLMRCASANNLLLVPFHNRRWDGDFQTVRRVIDEGSLGRLVSFESRLDRWRPDLPKDRLWKENAERGGGTLLDLGSHLADQILTLFGKPEAVSAVVLRERAGAGSNDAFTIRLRYPGVSVIAGANSLSLPPGPRFHLRGTKGNYLKLGVDAQEAALKNITRIEDPAWGVEPTASWGTLHIGIDGGVVSTPVRPVPGDYRLFYSGIRDAVLGKAPTPVQAIEAWRVARLLEWATESSERHCDVSCNWSEEPE